ncbi:MAG: hypothetical protein J07HX64_01567 [halophilic archaeon J07HX64]|nr:MAG: hypothetical protein J07HX64_01567 [halophilic archaeon J07HX64]
MLRGLALSSTLKSSSAFGRRYPSPNSSCVTVDTITRNVIPIIGISPYTVMYSICSCEPPPIMLMMTRMIIRSNGNSESVMYISPNSSSVSSCFSCSCLAVRMCLSFWSSRNFVMSPPESKIESMSVRNCPSSSLGVSTAWFWTAVR